jgi:serine/threonine-protein kinase
MQKKLLGNEHADLWLCLNPMGCTLMAKGEANAAESLFRESLAILHKRKWFDHWKTAHTESLLGSCLTALGRYDEAETLLQTSYSALKRLRGDNDRYTQESLRRLEINEDFRRRIP